MTLIEEWRWERSDENPLQPLWDSIVGYVKTEFERMEKKKEKWKKKN